MATGRTPNKYVRAYVDGYDMSGYSRSVGPLGAAYKEVEDVVFSNDIEAALLGQVKISVGTLSSVFDNTATSGPHVVLSGGVGTRDLMIALGVRAAPAQGDPVFAGQFEQSGYPMSIGDASLAVDIPFVSSGAQTSFAYDNPWGDLLHAKGAETAVNSAVGIDNPMAASTAFGGFMMYQVFAGNGTATLKVQDAATNLDGSFADLVTSGVVDFSTVQHGIVALGRTATVRRYLRWQIVLGTATTVTFALSFHRAFH